MKTTYLLTSIAREGAARLTYEHGALIGFETEFKPPLNPDKLGFLISNLAVAESEIDEMKSLGLTITKESPANEKLDLFCRIYEKHKSVKYKVTAAEAGKIKQINPTEEQLHAYFRSENFLFKGKQSISNLVKYWNEFRADLASLGKSKYPDEWQPELLKKLTPQQTIYYYAHLKGLGMQAIFAGGRVVGFK